MAANGILEGRFQKRTLDFNEQIIEITDQFSYEIGCMILTLKENDL